MRRGGQQTLHSMFARAALRPRASPSPPPPLPAAPPPQPPLADAAVPAATSPVLRCLCAALGAEDAEDLGGKRWRTHQGVRLMRPPPVQRH